MNNKDTPLTFMTPGIQRVLGTRGKDHTRVSHYIAVSWGWG